MYDPPFFDRLVVRLVEDLGEAFLLGGLLGRFIVA
jgi:hypothetical protein